MRLVIIRLAASTATRCTSSRIAPAARSITFGCWYRRSWRRRSVTMFCEVSNYSMPANKNVVYKYCLEIPMRLPCFTDRRMQEGERGEGAGRFRHCPTPSYKKHLEYRRMMPFPFLYPSVSLYPPPPLLRHSLKIK